MTYALCALAGVKISGLLALCPIHCSTHLDQRNDQVCILNRWPSLEISTKYRYQNLGSP